MHFPARANGSHVRRNNLELVLRDLGALGPDSRAGIAARTGLTRATVSRLVAELIDLGLVREGDWSASGRAGRPGRHLELDGRHVVAVGAEVNVDYLSVLAIDLAGRELHRDRRAFDAARAGPEASLLALAELCRAVLAGRPQHTHARPTIVAGLTVAVPGLVDVAAGVVARAPNLHWSGAAVAEPLGRALGLGRTPIHVGNDANLASIAEYRAGACAGTPNLVYVTGEVGIGGGIVVGGRPLLGARGYGGEVGHMQIDPAGPLCGCGRRGCWEATIGLNALLEQTDGPTRGTLPPEAKIAPIVRRAIAGESATVEVLAELGAKVGVGAANLANLFDPDVIILGGYFATLAEWILPPARRALAERLLAPPTDGPQLTVSDLGFTAAARGGAIHALDRVISDPTTLLGSA
jgi:predicted NBD/HSP70 family sugar kinase